MFKPFRELLIINPGGILPSEDVIGSMTQPELCGIPYALIIAGVVCSHPADNIPRRDVRRPIALRLLFKSNQISSFWLI